VTLLGFLWWSSLALGAAALTWMIWLILARLVRARRDARLGLDQARMRRLFLEIMEGHVDAARQLKAPTRRARLTAEAVLDIAGLVRGHERERLVAALSGLGVEERLRRRLGRGSKAGRIAAVEALAVFPAPANAAAIRAALSRARDPEFRVAALNALLALDEAPPLWDLLADVASRGLQDSLLYESVVRTLVARSPDQALAVFTHPDASPVMRTIVADALGRAGDYRAVPTLMAAADGAELELRIACVRALGVLAHPAAEPALLSGLSDAAWEVRAAAAEAVGRIGLVTAAPRLVQALADPVWWVRFRSGEALNALGDKGVASLRLAAGVDQDVVRRAASLALAERGVSA
jgi:hypothetical protein